MSAVTLNKLFEKLDSVNELSIPSCALLLIESFKVVITELKVLNAVNKRRSVLEDKRRSVLEDKRRSVLEDIAAIRTARINPRPIILKVWTNEGRTQSVDQRG